MLSSVEDLYEEFGVTGSTIRSDLAQLSTEGRLARTYGGARCPRLTPTSPCAGEAFEARSAIARWAMQQVNAAESLLLDAGSSVAALAHELRHRSDVRVATTGLTALEQPGESPGVHVECLGGRVRAASRGFIAPPTLKWLWSAGPSIASSWPLMA